MLFQGSIVEPRLLCVFFRANQSLDRYESKPKW